MAFQLDFIYLLKAIKEKKSIDIYYKGEDKTWNYSSRFLKLSSDSKSFIIDLPFMGEDTYKPLEIGFTIQIIFKLAGFRFQFAATVEDNIQYIIDRDKKIPALKISWPREIIEENQRSFFRVELSMDESINVIYNIVESPGEKKDTEADETDKSEEYQGVEAIIADISENGLKIKIKRDNNIKINDKLLLRFRLKELDDEYIEIDGIVRHIREQEDTPAFFCGVEFSKEDSPRHKQAIRKITFYLMSRRQENVNFFSVDSVISANPLVKRIVNSEVSHELLNMLVNIEFRLTNEEYLESLAHVVNRKEYESRAAAILHSIPVPVKVKYVERMEANHQTAYYLLTEAVKNRCIKIIVAVVNNQYLPVEFWLKLAREGTEPMLELLLEHPNKLLAYPEVLDVMTKNPAITPAVKERIEKIENHYLEGEEPALIPMEGLIPRVQQVIKKQMKERGEKLNIFTTAKARMEAISILKRINDMSVRERIRLALCGNKPERMTLTKDPNKEVLISLVESPWIGEDEILNMLENPRLPAEVVSRIADNSSWLRSYPIILSLVNHPGVPLTKAPGLIKRLRCEDLKQIVINKKTNPAVLGIADQIFAKTTMKK